MKFLYEVELQSQITGREMWREKERWPVSVGKKFYKVCYIEIRRYSKRITPALIYRTGGFASQREVALAKEWR